MLWQLKQTALPPNPRTQPYGSPAVTFLPAQILRVILRILTNISFKKEDKHHGIFPFSLELLFNLQSTLQLVPYCVLSNSRVVWTTMVYTVQATIH